MALHLRLRAMATTDVRPRAHLADCSTAAHRCAGRLNSCCAPDPAAATGQQTQLCGGVEGIGGESVVVRSHCFCTAACCCKCLRSAWFRGHRCCTAADCTAACCCNCHRSARFRGHCLRLRAMATTDVSPRAHLADCDTAAHRCAGRNDCFCTAACCCICHRSVRFRGHRCCIAADCHRCAGRNHCFCTAACCCQCRRSARFRGHCLRLRAMATTDVSPPGPPC